MVKRVIVHFPKFERLDLIQQLREKYDPLARFVAPHVTLVAPFESALSSAALEDHIRVAVAEIEAFPLTLHGITRNEDEYLFLNVTRGGAELTEVRAALYSGPLASYRLPQYPYSPHLTVGRILNREEFENAVAATANFAGVFHGWVNDVSVYRIEPNGSRPIDFSVSL